MKKIAALLLVFFTFMALLPSARAEGGTLRITIDDSAKNNLSAINATTAEIVGDGEEKEIKLTPKAPFADPYVYFNLKGYAKARGITVPKAENYKYLIVRVRQELCLNNMFELFYCTGSVTSAVAGRSVTTKFTDYGPEDQYLVFDMSEEGKKWRGNVNGFRIDYMLNASGEDEAFYVCEFIFAEDDAAAAAFVTVPEKGPDAYALTEQEQKRAEELIASAVESAPQVKNEALTAEHEDAGLKLWFDYSYAQIPAEQTEPNGKNTYLIRLAKNETEAAQLILCPDKDKTITVSVEDFKNGEAALVPRLYYGHYFDNVEGKSIVDPIPPLTGSITLSAGRSQMFLIKLKTEADTAPGLYSSVVRVFDGDGKEIKKADIYAYVWDFSLPDASAVKTLADLGWWSIYAADPSLYSGDGGVAYKNYYDTLLENKMNAYTMPCLSSCNYDELTEEELAIVTAYLDDPAVQAFNPLGWKTDITEERLISSYNFLSQKKEWLEKAYFYPAENDEPSTRADLDRVISNATAIKSVWKDDYKLIIPLHLNFALDKEYKTDYIEYLKDYVNVWCPHNYFFTTYEDKKNDPALTYMGSVKVDENVGTVRRRMENEKKEGDEIWWYVTHQPHDPEIVLSIDDPEVLHRILFWQQKLYDIDGFLYYSVNDWYGGGASQHNWGWDKKYEKDDSGLNPYIFYGNGVLIYHGGYLGTPQVCVESIRLESVRDGIEDYDCFVLLDRKYGEGTSDLMIKQITTSLGRYDRDEDKFDMVRTAVGNLLASDPKQAEPEETGTAADTGHGTDTEAEGNTGKGPSPLWFIIPAAVVAAAAIAAVVIVRRRSGKKA